MDRPDALIGGYLGIDPVKLESEKRAMLEEIRQANEARPKVGEPVEGLPGFVVVNPEWPGGTEPYMERGDEDADEVTTCEKP